MTLPQIFIPFYVTTVLIVCYCYLHSKKTHLPLWDLLMIIIWELFENYGDSQHIKNTYIFYISSIFKKYVLEIHVDSMYCKFVWFLLLFIYLAYTSLVGGMYCLFFTIRYTLDHVIVFRGICTVSFFFSSIRYITSGGFCFTTSIYISTLVLTM